MLAVKALLPCPMNAFADMTVYVRKNQGYYGAGHAGIPGHLSRWED
jgi:hypothetical protein